MTHTDVSSSSPAALTAAASSPTQSQPFGQRLWATLCSSSFLFAALLGTLLLWGGQILLGWWGATLSTNAAGWLYLVVILWLLNVLFVRLWSIRIGGWLLVLALLSGLLTVYIATGSSAQSQVPSLYRSLLRQWPGWLLWLKLAAPQLFGGLLFFALLARFFELATLLTRPNALTPSLEQAQLYTWRSDHADVTAESLQQMLTDHIGPSQTGDDNIIWAEQGRSAALGELWLLLGGLIALGGAAWLAVASGNTGSLRWSRLLLGVIPWIAIGALLQMGTPFITARASWEPYDTPEDDEDDDEDEDDEDDEDDEKAEDDEDDEDEDEPTGGQLRLWIYSHRASHEELQHLIKSLDERFPQPLSEEEEDEDDDVEEDVDETAEAQDAESSENAKDTEEVEDAEDAEESDVVEDKADGSAEETDAKKTEDPKKTKDAK